MQLQAPPIIQQQIRLWDYLHHDTPTQPRNQRPRAGTKMPAGEEPTKQSCAVPSRTTQKASHQAEEGDLELNRTSAEGHEFRGKAVLRPGSFQCPTLAAEANARPRSLQSKGHQEDIVLVQLSSKSSAFKLPHSLWDFISLPGSLNCQSRKNKQSGFKDSLAIWTLERILSQTNAVVAETDP